MSTINVETENKSAQNDDNNNNSSSSVDKYASLIEEVRAKFHKMVQNDPSQFDEEEIQRVNEDDMFVKRFLLSRKRKVDATVDMMANTLRWVKREGFTRIPLNAFPAEVFLIGALFDYEKDLQNNYTIYIRVCYILRCGYMVPHLIRWASKFFYELDQRVQGSFYAVIIDFADCGLRNCEYEFIYHAINTVRSYLPACVSYILVVDLPKILRYGWNVIKRIVPADQRKLLNFVTRNEIDQYIGKENLPDFLGGTCTRPHKGLPMVPDGCPTAVEYGIRCGIPLEECLKVARVYEPIVKQYGIYDLGEDGDLVALVEKEIKSRKEGKAAGLNILNPFNGRLLS
ncbi:motile sperm domain-containing protein 2-like [Brevipalpus obovatus]|uniref:motile sperm domain-containing protein 2-like n=1 Tax=Brevipalpus obovatus TaxID=246614 RepID=UPI003D9F8537